HPDLFAVWADRSGLVARSDNWPQGLEIPSAPNHHWNFEWNRVPYHALRVSQVPILDREEGKAFRPQTLTIFYAAPTIRLRMQVRRAGAFIALAGMLLLAATVLLALRGIRRGLRPLERLEQLLQWMLRLARAEQWAHGALRRDLEVIDINATCEEAIERIRNLAQSRNTAVHLSTNGPVPFRADPEDLQLVWINLLEN